MRSHCSSRLVFGSRLVDCAKIWPVCLSDADFYFSISIFLSNISLTDLTLTMIAVNDINHKCCLKRFLKLYVILKKRRLLKFRVALITEKVLALITEKILICFKISFGDFIIVLVIKTRTIHTSKPVILNFSAKGLFFFCYLSA